MCAVCMPAWVHTLLWCCIPAAMEYLYYIVYVFKQTSALLFFYLNPHCLGTQW